MTVTDLSTDRDGIFAGDDPFELARSWFAEAVAVEPNDPDAVCLSSVDPDGLPNVRMVLMRKIESDSFVFFTNYESQKGHEILSSGNAAFVWHSKMLRRQIRVRGQVEKEDGPVADEYYDSRSLKSRLGAWASAQSQPLKDRGVLERRLTEVTDAFGEAPERPPNWGGIRIRPLEFEFWADGAFRLHDRFRWTRAQIGGNWLTQRLSP